MRNDRLVHWFRNYLVIARSVATRQSVSVRERILRLRCTLYSGAQNDMHFKFLFGKTIPSGAQWRGDSQRTLHEMGAATRR